jgi:hypothetical protein
MSNPNTFAQEVEELLEILNFHDVPLNQLEACFEEFSIEAKNELVARVAQTFDPPPKGKLLARLLFILTEENKSDMTNAFIENLRSSYPEARKASLYGLEKLAHPGIVDFALNALRDDNDQVLVAAVTILLPKARENIHIWRFLQGFYTIHKGEEDFYGSTSLLEAHGINHPNSDDS